MSITLTERQGDLEVSAVVHRMGDDIAVLLFGGTRPHIGAVGIAQPRPSLRDPAVRSATGSVFTIMGHKEDMVAKQMAEDLAKGLDGTVVVVAGIHWDNLTADGIQAVTGICRRLTERIVRERG